MAADPIQPAQPAQPPESEFDKLVGQADSGELTPEKFNQELNRYADAYRQEFESDLKAEPDNVEEYTRDFFKKNVHASAAQIVWLSNNAESDTVKLSASKYVVEMALADGERDGDPIKGLLAELSKKKAPTPMPNT